MNYFCWRKSALRNLNTKIFFMRCKRSTKHDGTSATHWWQSVERLIQLAPVTMVLVNCARLGIICGKMDTTAPLKIYPNCGV